MDRITVGNTETVPEKTEENRTLPTFQQEKYLWLKSRREIDLMQVDTELSEIGVLVQEASECAAQANEIANTLKENLAYVEAKESSILRALPDANNKTRSEQRINSEVLLTQGVIDAQEEYAECRLDAALWLTMAEAMRTKSWAIKAATDLIVSGFITTDYVRDKRRQAIRDAGPRG